MTDHIANRIIKSTKLSSMDIAEGLFLGLCAVTILLITIITMLKWTV